jgi:hypothetical protein
MDWTAAESLWRGGQGDKAHRIDRKQITSLAGILTNTLRKKQKRPKLKQQNAIQKRPGTGASLRAQERWRAGAALTWGAGAGRACEAVLAPGRSKEAKAGRTKTEHGRYLQQQSAATRCMHESWAGGRRREHGGRMLLVGSRPARKTGADWHWNVLTRDWAC